MRRATVTLLVALAVGATGAVGCGGGDGGGRNGGGGGDSSAGPKSASWDEIDRDNYRIAKQICGADKATQSKQYRQHGGDDDPYGYAEYYAGLYRQDRRPPALQGCLEGLGIKP